jgi:hypothetical protein
MRGANQRDDDILIDGKDIALLSGSSDSLDHPNFAPAFLTCWPSFNHPSNVVLNAEQADAITIDILQCVSTTTMESRWLNRILYQPC